MLVQSKLVTFLSGKPSSWRHCFMLFSLLCPSAEMHIASLLALTPALPSAAVSFLFQTQDTRVWGSVKWSWKKNIFSIFLSSSLPIFSSGFRVHVPDDWLSGECYWGRDADSTPLTTIRSNLTTGRGSPVLIRVHNTTDVPSFPHKTSHPLKAGC